METKPKLLIFAAPSGAGKTTIVRHVMSVFPQLGFSVSATTRSRRPHETDGKDYYFLDVPTFKQRVEQGHFVEWEEVYEGVFYGTLRSELIRLSKAGKIATFDVDVVGAIDLKEQFGEDAVTVFVKPPSLEALRQRLVRRNTETPETLAKRLAKATQELAFENKFDVVLVNDVLEDALITAEKLVADFLQETQSK